jgi:hypothetical protein
VVPELTAQEGGLEVECHVLDYGPGGLLAFQRAAVYRELGIASPLPEQPPLTLDDVRQALRDYSSPTLLGSGPLAPRDGSIVARAEAARSRIDDAVAASFGASADEALLRQVLARGYLDPAPTHEAAAAELHLSRTAYFRRLRIAVERVGEQLGAHA